MQQFMWQPDLSQVANFFDAGIKGSCFRSFGLQTVDPNEGSNILSSGWNDVTFLSCLVLSWSARGPQDMAAPMLCSGDMNFSEVTNKIHTCSQALMVT